MIDTTIVIATCPIPSHPSTILIETAIRFLRYYKELEQVPILIYCDGVHPTLEHRRVQYEEYKQNLHKLCESEWSNVRVLESDEHIHQCNVMRQALEEVKTSTVLVAAHGWLFWGHISWGKLVEATQRPDVNSIRFYIFDEIHPEHSHLFALDREIVNGVSLMRTIQFGDGPALYKTEWYKSVIQKYVSPNARCFNEQILWPIFHNLGWENFSGLWIYAPEGSLNRNAIMNEREQDPSPPQNIESM